MGVRESLAFLCFAGLALPALAQTPDCGDPAGEVAFRDAVEFAALTGAQGCWDSVASQATSTIAADAAAAADATTPFGMRVFDGAPTNGTSRAVKALAGVPAAERWIATLDLRVTDMTFLPVTGDPEVPVLFVQMTGGHPSAAEIDLRLVNNGSGGVYEPETLAWRLSGRQDSGAFYSGLTPAGDASTWRSVRIVLTPSSAPGMTDGTLELYVDGTAEITLTGVDTALQTSPTEVRLGRAGGTLPSSPPLEATLDFDNFALRAIRQTEIAAVDDELYRVTLGNVGDPTSRFDVTALPGDFDGSGVKLDDHGAAIGQVQVTRTGLPGGETQWNLAVTPAAGLAVFEAEFPILRLAPIEGRADRSDDRLVVPFGLGEALDDVHSRVNFTQASPRNVQAIWYGVYGSKFQNLQLLLYEDTDAVDGGVMWWTRDPDLYIKDFAVKEILEGDYKDLALRGSVHHFPPNTGQTSAAWTLPYPVITTPYSGDWYDAIARYRSWARASAPWLASGPLLDRITSGALPSWYDTNVLWKTGISSIELPFFQSLRNLLDEDPETATIETGVLISQWQQHAFDTNLPDYFPPKSGCDQPDGDGDGTPDCWYFDYADLQATQRFRMFPYMNIHLASVNQFTPPYTPVIPTFANSSAVADALAAEGPTWGFGDHIEVWGSLPHHAMCRGKSVWIDAISDLIGRNLGPYDPGTFTNTTGGYGTAGHYVDQLNSGSHYPCMEAFTFGGQPQFGFGNYHTQGVRQMASQVHAANPGKLLMGEGVFEGYVDLIPEAYLIEPSPLNHEVVPLFPTVYQGYSAQHEWPIFPVTDPVDLENVSSLLAPSIHAGHKLGSFQSTVFWKQILETTPPGQTAPEPCVPAERDICDYLLALARLKLRTFDVVAYGERLRDPVVDPSDNTQHTVHWCPTNVVPCPGYPTTTERDVDVVEASSWRSLRNPVRQVLLLSNGRASDLAVRVAAADFPAGTWLDSHGNPTVYDPAIALNVPGTDSATHQGWLALTTDFDDDGIRDDVDPAIGLPEPTGGLLAGLALLASLARARRR